VIWTRFFFFFLKKIIYIVPGGVTRPGAQSETRWYYYSSLSNLVYYLFLNLLLCYDVKPYQIVVRCAVHVVAWEGVCYLGHSTLGSQPRGQW
jgi:hypothetical protein